MDYLITGVDYLSRFKDFRLVGREAEMSLLSSILVRKKANSAIIVGPSGVGATALILGLQAMKDDEHAAFDIVAKRLFWLDVDAMFSSGNSEEIGKAFNAAMQRLKSTISPVLVIEDSGDFYEACRNSGMNHFVNIINSAVKNGQIQAIFEVIDRDLPKIISWHSDFREIYTTMDLTEPTGEALKDIVELAAKKLSSHHAINIDVDAILATVELTSKYRVDKGGLGNSQPARAISLMDRALASYRLSAHKNPPYLEALKAAGALDEFVTESASHAKRVADLRTAHSRQRNAENAVAEVQDRLRTLKEELKTKVKEAPQTTGVAAMFANAGTENDETRRLANQIAEYSNLAVEAAKDFERITQEINSKLLLERSTVLYEFSRITGISASKLGEDDLAVLRMLEADMKKSVVGQDHILKQLADAIKVSRIGGRNKNRPQASFMFLGSSGVGKTFVAKVLAKALYGDESALLRFDMSEYGEKHATAKLIGAPAGYEGFEHGGILTNAMRENRNRIILFDEIEKADKTIFDLLLQVLDDGRLTDNVGLTADFSESIILLTTNIGQEFLLDTEITFEEAVQSTLTSLDTHYRPEFLNRFSGRKNIVCFNRLSVESIFSIVMRDIKDLIRAYEPNGIEVVVSDEDVMRFCEETYDARTGARGPSGFITAQLEPQVTDLILEGEKGRFEFVYADGKFVRK